MRKIIVMLMLAAVVSFAGDKPPAQTGRTKPDKHKINNYGTKGNTNPKSFKNGKKSPHKLQPPKK